MKSVYWILIGSAVAFVLFVTASAIFFRSAVQKKSFAAKKLFQHEGVGLLEIEGVILDSEKILEKLEDFEESPEVKALVVRINSPGGAVAPSQEIHKALLDFPKPVVVSMGSVAASGGYYIAVAAKKIFANPGTLTGSIGVIMEFANLEKLYDWAKIKRFVIKTGKFKDIGSESRPMTDEEREYLQGLLNNTQTQFKKAILEGRKLTPEKLDPIADGRIMNGEQAKALGLVDELGGEKEAVLEAGKMAGISGKPKVITINKKKSFLDYLQDSSMEENSLLDVFLKKAGVQELQKRTPGLYWLWAP